jgi:hypothetical protein
MHCTPFQLYLKSILILSSHLLLGLPSGRPHANEEEGMVSQNTTVIFGGAFYLG